MGGDYEQRWHALPTHYNVDEGSIPITLAYL